MARIKTTGLANSLIAATSAINITSIVVYNSGPAQWIKVYNRATAPASDTDPDYIFKLDQDQTLNLFGGIDVIKFSTGLVIANSTTGPTYTAGAADCKITVDAFNN